MPRRRLTYGPDIHPRAVGRPVDQQLWGAVPSGGHILRHLARQLGTARRHHARKAEVAQLQDARGGQQHVLGLDVAVDDLRTQAGLGLRCGTSELAAGGGWGYMHGQPAAWALVAAQVLQALLLGGHKERMSAMQACSVQCVGGLEACIMGVNPGMPCTQP